MGGLTRREYTLGEREFGVTLQAGAHDFARLEVYDGYFALTWSTPWKAIDYARLAQHVLEESNGAGNGARLIMSEDDRDRQEAVGSRAVAERLDEFVQAPDPVEFVRVDSTNPVLEQISISWLADLPSKRLRGSAIGFVGNRFSQDYVTKLLRRSATATIKDRASEVTEMLSDAVPEEMHLRS